MCFAKNHFSKIIVTRESCQGSMSQSSRTYIQTGRARWLITEVYERLYRVVNAPIVPCAFSMRVARGCNINFKFSWEYPVSCSATVPSRFTTDRSVDSENINENIAAFF